MTIPLMSILSMEDVAGKFRLGFKYYLPVPIFLSLSPCARAGRLALPGVRATFLLPVRRSSRVACCFAAMLLDL